MRKVAYTLCAIVLLLSPTVALAAGGSSEPKAESKEDDKRAQAIEAYDKGLAHVEKANSYAAASDSLFAYNYRATSDAKARDQFEDAVKDFKKAIKHDPSLIEAHNYLGFSYRKLGDFESALAAYNAALAIDSLYEPALEYRGELFLATDRYADAFATYELLQSLESPYADSLKLAIDLFRLQEIDAMMPEKSSE